MKIIKLTTLIFSLFCFYSCEKETTNWEKEGLDTQTPLTFKAELARNTSDPYANYAAVNEITQSNIQLSTYTLFIPALAGAERASILSKQTSRPLRIKPEIGIKSEFEPKIKDLVYEHSQKAFLIVQSNEFSDVVKGECVRIGAGYDFTHMTHVSSKLSVMLKDGQTQNPIVGEDIKVEIMQPLVANRLTEQSQDNDVFDYAYHFHLGGALDQPVFWISDDEYKRINEIGIIATCMKESNPQTNRPIELFHSNTPKAPANMYASVIAPQILWGKNAKYSAWIAETKEIVIETADAVNSSIRVTIPAKTSINKDNVPQSYTIDCGDISIISSPDERASLTEIKSGESVVITLLLDATQKPSATAQIYKW